MVVPPDRLGPASIPTRVGLQPRFTDPMYERVRALSVDYLVPGVGSVPNNIGRLLEINPAYIEAFLVGLNHEMSRELRWREYPAALGQTWFQQFFDSVDPGGGVDVSPIDAWVASCPRRGVTAESRTATQGRRARGADQGRPDPQVPRRPRLRRAGHHRRGGRAGARSRAPRATPRFVGTLGRGINFYGFDTLTEEVARGDGAGHGWFFVLEEEPRAMRFGLDRAAGEGRRARVVGQPGVGAPRRGGRRRPVVLLDRPVEQRSLEEDIGTGLEWGDDAAVMAAITFRRPIQVFMHASAMLPWRCSD